MNFWQIRLINEDGYINPNDQSWVVITLGEIKTDQDVLMQQADALESVSLIFKRREDQQGLGFTIDRLEISELGIMNLH